MERRNAMSIRIGYLLPTRERIMAKQHRWRRCWNWLSWAPGLRFCLGQCTSKIADLKAPLAAFRQAWADLRTAAADKTQPLELPRLPPRRAETEARGAGQRYLLDRRVKSGGSKCRRRTVSVPLRCPS